MAFLKLQCSKCGGELQEKGNVFECGYCRTTYLNDQIERESEALKRLLDEQKQEQLASYRHLLWEAVHAENIDSAEIIGLCKSIRALVPEDFAARFFEVANGGTEKQVNAFLREADLTDPTQAFWAEEMISFMIKSLRAGNLLAVQSLIERAYKETDLEKYEKYSTAFSVEAAKVDGGVYEPNEPRDVFVMYSGKDMKAVEELVAHLEERGLTCFVAMRNLQHGRGAVANYQSSIEKAMRACKTVVFVSSKHSRSFSCDAVRVELPYFINHDNQKPRVEYCLDSEKGGSGLVKEFFAGLERVYSKEAAADRVENMLIAPKSVEKETAIADKKENFDLHAEEKKAEKQEEKREEPNEATGKANTKKESDKAPMVETNAHPAEEIFQKGEMFAGQFDWNSAVKCYKEAAAQNHAGALFRLGECYEHGRDVGYNRERAYKYYKMAAAQNHAEAVYNVGRCFDQGIGVSYNHKKALEWYEKAGEMGYAEAQYEAGKKYEGYSYGIKKDYIKAAKWFEQAAKQGHAAAQCEIGSCYVLGHGVKVNQKKAIIWYEKSMRQGYEPAKRHLKNTEKTVRNGVREYIDAINALKKEAETDEDKAICLENIWKLWHVCAHCGGGFKGLFSKVCSICGKQKDY